jgi:ABC-type nitrate/sulfonate/bicarbonate transport system substrate-binding protein
MLAILANGDTGISSVADLKGKRVGTITGTSPDLYLRTLLRRANVAETDLQIMNLKTTELVAAMKKRDLDATVAAEPYPEQILAEVPGTKTVVRGGGVVSQRILFVSMEDWLGKNPALAEKMVAGITEAMWWTRQNLDEAGDISARWLGGGADPLVIRKAIRNITYDPRHTKLAEQSWNNEGSLLVEQKRIKAPVAYAEGFDPTFANKIPQLYPQWVADLKPLP